MGRKVTRLPKEIAYDLANLTSREFCAKYRRKPGQVNGMRTAHGIRMTEATVARSYVDRVASMKDPGFTKEMAATMTAHQISASTGLRPRQVEGRIHDLGWRKRDLRVDPEVKPKDMIAALESQGYRVSRALPHEPIVRLEGKPGTKYKFAAFSCTHLGNVAQQLTYLHDFYRYAEAQGVEDFWNAGDTTDGPDSMHRDAVHEHFIHTFDAAVDYWVDAYPKPKNGKTRLILGNHDEAWLKDPSGADIGRAIAMRRPDVEYVGRRAADIHVGGVRIYLMHGAGGGAYARTYKLQKTIEAFPPARRPHILLLGNYHVPAHLPAYVGCEGFMLPSFEASTPFITALGKESVIGGLILEIELGQTGLRDIKVEWRMWDIARKGDHPK